MSDTYARLEERIAVQEERGSGFEMVGEGVQVAGFLDEGFGMVPRDDGDGRFPTWGRCSLLAESHAGAVDGVEGDMQPLGQLAEPERGRVRYQSVGRISETGILIGHGINPIDIWIHGISLHTMQDGVNPNGARAMMTANLEDRILRLRRRGYVEFSRDMEGNNEALAVFEEAKSREMDVEIVRTASGWRVAERS